jgi:hypothetical protein
MDGYGRAERQRIRAERARYGIQFNRGGNRDRTINTLYFRFMRNDDYTIQVRFEQVARDIRRTIRDFFGRRDDGRDYRYLLTFGFAQRPVRTIAGITDDFLMETFENILHSNEAVTLEGFRVFFFLNSK